jgi:hypothetical protein
MQYLPLISIDYDWRISETRPHYPTIFPCWLITFGDSILFLPSATDFAVLKATSARKYRGLISILPDETIATIISLLPNVFRPVKTGDNVDGEPIKN